VLDYDEEIFTWFERKRTGEKRVTGLIDLSNRVSVLRDSMAEVLRDPNYP
jgi:hypothetical protein